MVMVGLLAFVVGFTTILLVLKWPWSPEWFEAIGTWFGGLITAVVGIVAFLTYVSQDQERRRTYRLEREAIEQARRDDDEQLRLAANQVLCDPRPPVSRPGPAPGIVLIREFQFEVTNKATAQSPISFVNCVSAISNGVRSVKGSSPVSRFASGVSWTMRLRSI
jgi:hypothetical protein